MHLPDHIRRFGPAMLFATEAFESFNAIIRGKSVHSNRHAPSRDIAHAFAESNGVRHILSGGRFQKSITKVIELPPKPSSPHVLRKATVYVRPPFSTSAENWLQMAVGPRTLVQEPNIATEYLGLQVTRRWPLTGELILEKTSPCRFEETSTGRHTSISMPGMFHTAGSVVLSNDDICKVKQFVIVRDPSSPGQTYVGQVTEILATVSPLSTNIHSVLVHIADVTQSSPHYDMPQICLTEEFHSVDLKVDKY